MEHNNGDPNCCKMENKDPEDCSDEITPNGLKKRLTIEELEQLATKNNPTFSKERNSYGGFTTKSFNTLKINHQAQVASSQASDSLSRAS